MLFFCHHKKEIKSWVEATTTNEVSDKHPMTESRTFSSCILPVSPTHSITLKSTKDYAPELPSLCTKVPGTVYNIIISHVLARLGGI